MTQGLGRTVGRGSWLRSELGGAQCGFAETSSLVSACPGVICGLGSAFPQTEAHLQTKVSLVRRLWPCGVASATTGCLGLLLRHSNLDLLVFTAGTQ